MCKVSIIVLTYNQESTIRRTLSSIISQETTYDYEIIIGEDASIDSTRKVCEDFIANNPGLPIKLTSKASNLGVVRNYINCITLCSGEYIMECAGDDWWHSPNKIQLQVEYMDSHPECVLLHSGYNIFYPRHNVTKSVLPNKKNTTLDLIQRNTICAPTICARMSAIRSVDFDEFINHNFNVEDFPLWITISTKGEVHSMDEYLATYSVCWGTLERSRDYHKRIDYLKQIHNIRLFFIEKYKISETLRCQYDDYYFKQLWDATIRHSERLDAIYYSSLIKRRNLKFYIKRFCCYIPSLFHFLHIKQNEDL